MEKRNRIIIITKFNNWQVPPNVVNLIIRLHNKYECRVYYQKSKRFSLKKILKKRGFFVWLDLILAKYPFRFMFPLRWKMFGRKNYIELMKERVNRDFENTERWFKDFASFYYVENINEDSAMLKDVEKNPPLLIVSMGAPILRRKFLKKIDDLKILAINSHIGITPYYMGSSPFIWALQKKDFAKIGFTIHKIREKIDYGDWLYQRTINISNCKTLIGIDWKLLIESSTFLAQKIMSQEIFSARAHAHRIQYKSFPPAGFFVTLKAFINFRRFVKLCKRNEL